MFTGHNDGVSPYQLLSGQMSSDHFPVSFKDLGASIVDDDLGGQKMIDGVLVRQFFPRIIREGAWPIASKRRDGRLSMRRTMNCRSCVGDVFPDPDNTGPLRRCPQALVQAALGAGLPTRDAQDHDKDTRRRGNGGHSSCYSATVSPSRPGRKAWLFSIITRTGCRGPLMRRSSPAASGPPPAARR